MVDISEGDSGALKPDGGLAGDLDEVFDAVGEGDSGAGKPGWILV